MIIFCNIGFVHNTTEAFQGPHNYLCLATKQFPVYSTRIFSQSQTWSEFAFFHYDQTTTIKQKVRGLLLTQGTATSTLLAGTTPRLDPTYCLEKHLSQGQQSCRTWKSLEVTGKGFQEPQHCCALQLPQQGELHHRRIPASTYSDFAEGKEAQWPEGQLESLYL